MGNQESIAVSKKMCPAMVQAGVKNPESAEGILFCAGDRTTESSCPYPYCVALEKLTQGYNSSRVQKRERKRKLARDLYSHRVSLRDIALILNKHTRTITRYLGKK